MQPPPVVDNRDWPDPLAVKQMLVATDRAEAFELALALRFDSAVRSLLLEIGLTEAHADQIVDDLKSDWDDPVSENPSDR